MATVRSAIETDIANILNKANLATYISVWFEYAHHDIQERRNWKAQETTGNAALLVATTDSYANLLTDVKYPLLVYMWDNALSLVNNFYRITSIEDMRKRRYDEEGVSVAATLSDEDMLVAFFGGNVHVWPTPGTDAAGKYVRLDYHKWMDPPAVAVSDWFTNNARIYLTYKALTHSAPFLAEDPRLAVWEAMAEQAYQRISGADIDFDQSGPAVMRG